VFDHGQEALAIIAVRHGHIFRFDNYSFLLMHVPNQKSITSFTAVKSILIIRVA
jgi:hypothetical protein